MPQQIPDRFAQAAIGFAWNTTVLQCWRNCSMVPNNFQGANVNAFTCQCDLFYDWSVSVCLPSSLDCTTVANSAGANTLSTCFCNVGYFFANRLCVIDCLLIPYTTNATTTSAPARRLARENLTRFAWRAES